MQQIVIHIFSLADGIPLYSLSQLSIKLFILTTAILLNIFQYAGFVVDSMRIFIRYLSLLYCAILFVDVVFMLFGLQQCYYTVLLSGIMGVLIFLLLGRFFMKCIERYDLIKESVRKENLVNALKIACIGFLASYTVFISAVSEGDDLISILALLCLLVLHIYIVYKSYKRYGVEAAVKSYVPVEGEERGPALLLEEKIVDYQTIINKLILYFEKEKPYLDSDLKIADVCKRIYTNKTYVSRALNHGVSKNFNQFVNYYRVREACMIFIEEPIISISDLCDKCGFKNLSSFSNAFNLNLGYTPAEWCRQVRKKLNNNEEVSIEDYFN
ncbi:MAG: helix-turn-helix transcriptional regulator [Bacteroidales bacterium]|nr:helix-turn-helix transcriptional regulator [Bacteroidales bacterium]